jgi:hypothetical protein
MSLFELEESLRLLLASAVEAGEENHGEIRRSFSKLCSTIARRPGEKVDNIARYIHAHEAVIAIAGTEAQRYSQRKARAENLVSRLKGLLKFFMDSRQIRSMKGCLNTISLRKNSQDSLLFSDPTSVPVEYCRVSITKNAAEWNDAVQYLPENHPIRVRFANPDAVKREPDNARIRKRNRRRHRRERSRIEKRRAHSGHMDSAFEVNLAAGASGMNAQLYTLRDVTRLPTGGWTKFLRTTSGTGGAETKAFAASHFPDSRG